MGVTSSGTAISRAVSERIDGEYERWPSLKRLRNRAMERNDSLSVEVDPSWE